MLFFAIQLDEEQIKEDGIINLDAAYRTIEKTFAQRDVSLYKIHDGIRIYTRNIDEHDFEYLWMVNSPFKKASWFQYYVKIWRFIITDDETKEIETDEDVMEEWVIRPDRP